VGSQSKFSQIAQIIGGYAFTIAIVNTIHFQLLPVHVVLYDTILDVVIAGAIVLTICFLLMGRQSYLTKEEITLSILVGLLIGLFYAISVPTVIDRSLSMYLLEKISQRGGGIRQDAVERVFKDEYMREQRPLDIRLTEQINSGTIVVKNGCVGLTDRGLRIVAFTRFYRTHLLPKRREIMGQLTDELTDPFRHSSPTVDYACDPNTP
jgi:hypothetical protein